MQIKQIKTTVKRLSLFGFCISEYDCYRIDAIKKYKDKFIEANDLYVSDRGRVYTPVLFCRSATRMYWMDCITGTLFTVTGFNKTTNFRLDVESLAHNQERGEEILRTTKILFSNDYGRMTA
jgi:hypothetical protein